MNNFGIEVEFNLEEIEEFEPFDDVNCADFVSIIIDCLDNPMHIGIAKAYIDNGYTSLSEKQKTVFKLYVLKPFMRRCKHDGTFLWEEAYMIYEDGLCSYCEHMHNKDD